MLAIYLLEQPEPLEIDSFPVLLYVLCKEAIFAGAFMTVKLQEVRQVYFVRKFLFSILRISIFWVHVQWVVLPSPNL